MTGYGWRPMPSPWGAGVWLLAASAAGLALMAWDALKARRGGRRVPVHLIWLVALLGGTPGLLLGLELWRRPAPRPGLSWGLALLLLAQLWWLGRRWR